MKRRTKTLTVSLLLIIMMALLSCDVKAQNASGGVSPLFTAGVGARALSLGGAFVALSDDPTAVYWNPAGIDFIQKKSATFFYSSLDFGTSYNFISGVWPTLSFGAFGLGWARIGTDGVIPYDDDANQTGAEGDFGIDQFLFSYGKQIRKTVSAGGNLKIERMNFAFENIADTRVGLDLAVLYKPDFDSVLLRDLAFGLNIQNAISSKMRLNKADEAAPINFRAGLSKLFVMGEGRNKLRLLLDVNQTENGGASTHAGTEYSFSDQASMRLGFNDGQIALGAGATYRNLEIDYNFGKYFDAVDFASSHRFSVTIHFGKGRDDLIRIARLEREREVRMQVQDSLWINAELEFNNNMEAGRDKYYDRDFMGAFVAFSGADDAAKNMEEISLRLRTEPNSDQEAEMRVQTAFSATEEVEDWTKKANTKIDSLQTQERQRIYLEAAVRERETARVGAIEELQTFVNNHREKGLAFFKGADYARAINEWRLLVSAIDNSAIEDIPQEFKTLKLQVESDIGTARGQLESKAKQERREVSRLTFGESFNQGRRYYDSKDWKNAEAAFAKALESDPNSTEARNYHERAKARSVATMQDMPQRLRQKYARSTVFLRQKKLQEALQLLEEMRKEQPYNKRILDRIDLVEEQMKKQ